MVKLRLSHQQYIDVGIFCAWPVPTKVYSRQYKGFVHVDEDIVGEIERAVSGQLT